MGAIKHYFCLTSVLCLCWLFTLGQTPRFQHLTAADGLSQNSINDIHQDAFGYLWFATQDGLNRFDGYEFKIYRPDNSDPWALSDNFVTNIWPASDGNFFLGTRFGLNYFDRQSERFFKFDKSGDYLYNQPTEMFEKEGRQFVVFNGLAYAIPKEFSAPQQFLPDSATMDIDSSYSACFFADVVLLLGSEKLQIIKAGDTLVTPLRSSILINRPRIICQEETPFVLYGDQVLRIDLYQNRIDTIIRTPNEQILDVLPLGDGRMWIATQYGIYDWLAGSTQKIEHDPEDPYTLSAPLVHTLFRDCQGTLWAGTANGGLNYIPRGADRFQYMSEKDGLADKQVWSAFTDSQGTLWVGTETGVSISGSARFSSIVDQLRGVRVTAMAEDSTGQLWLGSVGRGIYIVNKARTEVNRISLPAEYAYSQNITAFEAQGENMWVGSHDLCYRFNLKGECTKILNPDRQEKLNYILSLNHIDAYLYIGTPYALSRYHLGQDRLEHFFYRPGGDSASPSFQFITDIIEGDSGTIWISTFGGGINAFDSKRETFEYFDKAEGLKNGVIAGMVKHDDALWLSHNLGISKFDIPTRTFQNFGVHDGLPFPEFSLGCRFIDKSGRIYFGGTDGLVSFLPQNIEPEPFDARPLLSSIEVNYEKLLLKDVLPEELTQLELKPKDAVVSFRFVVPNFVHATELKYAYMMEGFDPDWVEAPNSERLATYSNLPAGNYQFKVRVADQNGTWSSNTFALPISVIPPLWQRWWFIALTAFLLLALIVSVVRFISQLEMKRKLRELELKQRVHRERARISMDLHDHVGAQITYLISNLDRLEMQNGKGDSTIGGLGKYAREAMRELRDTVWAIRRDQMQFSELAQRINQFGSHLFENSETTFKMTFERGFNPLIEPAPSLHLLRIVQEALQNAFKYAQASHVMVKLASVGSELQINIHDDGVGFNESGYNEEEHNGLRNMRDRASEIGATFSLKTTQGSGTSITLSYHLQNKAKALIAESE